MTVKQFCNMTGANQKTVYRKIKKLRNTELSGHISDDKGESMTLDQYAVDFLLPMQFRLQSADTQHKKESEARIKAVNEKAALNCKLREALTETDGLKAIISELTQKADKLQECNDQLASKCEYMNSQLTAEQKKRCSLQDELYNATEELSEKNAVIAELTKTVSQLQAKIDAVPERIRRKYLKEL